MLYSQACCFSAEQGRLYASTAPAMLCATCYMSYDHLGRVRLVTDQSGAVVARHDYLPFGEEIAAGTAGRPGLFGMTDNISQKFTGQERDAETGLDFMQARYYGAALGRFTSPDPANAGADLTNPQSWNAYAYVLGNPLALTDPTGLSPITDPCAVNPNCVTVTAPYQDSGNSSTPSENHRRVTANYFREAYCRNRELPIQCRGRPGLLADAPAAGARHCRHLPDCLY